MVPQFRTIKRPESRLGERAFHHFHTENVMVHASIFQVAQRPLAEFLRRAYGMHDRIVQAKNLIKMSEVIFSSFRCQIFLKVFEGSKGSIAIEDEGALRHQYEQRASPLQDTMKFLQGTQRIGYVLENMRRQQEVIGVIADGR